VSSFHKIAQTLLKEVLVQDLTLTKKDGNQYSIKGYIQSERTIDTAFREVGFLEKYTVVGYFYPSYTVGTTTVKVEEGDKITFQSQEYLVDRVTTHYFENKPVYTEAILEGR